MKKNAVDILRHHGQIQAHFCRAGFPVGKVNSDRKETALKRT